MLSKLQRLKATITGSVIAAMFLVPIAASGQDLVTTSSLTGSSSVFVFRSVSRTVSHRFVASSKPTRTRTQRLESVTKINKQYATIAKTTPQANRAKVIDPNKLPPNAQKTLPPDQASKLFAGVGEYYIQKDDFEHAFEFFTEAIRLDDKNTDAKNGYAEALSMKGNSLLEKDQTDMAKGVFLEAIRYNPTNVAANFGLGEVYSELDQQSDAIAAYEKSLANGKDLTEIYVPLGILYYQAGEIAKADDMLSKASAKDPEVAETQFFLGLVRASQNKPDEALAAFQKAKGLDQTYAEAFFNSAETLVKLKRTAEAIPDYQKAVALKPAYFEAWLGLGQALSETGKYADALMAFQTAKKLKNNNWEVFAGLADANRQTDKFEDASANYNLAALFYSQTKDADKEVLADLYSKAGFSLGQQCQINTAKNLTCPWPAAIKDLQKAVDLADNPLDYANLGWAYYNAARVDLDSLDKAAGNAKLELAKTALQKAIAGNQTVADGALQNLGAVQIDQGDFKGAIESLKGVVERRPDWTFSRYALATAYFKVNDFDSASKWFNAVIAKEPKFVPAIASLGYTEIKRKNGKEVRRIIEMLKPLDATEAAKLELSMKTARL